MLRFLINTQTGKPAVPARPPKALPPTKQKPIEAAPKRKPEDAEERPRKKKRVFVSGCFDLLHSGHVAFFKEAAALGELRAGYLSRGAETRQLHIELARMQGDLRAGDLPARTYGQGGGQPPRWWWGMRSCASLVYRAKR